MNPGHRQQSRTPDRLSTALQATELAQITKSINWKVRFTKNTAYQCGRVCLESILTAFQLIFYKRLQSKLENSSDVFIPSQTSEILLSDLPGCVAVCEATVCMAVYVLLWAFEGMHHCKGFLPGISAACTLKSCTCLQRRSNPPHKHIALWIIIEKKCHSLVTTGWQSQIYKVLSGIR